MRCNFNKVMGRNTGVFLSLTGAKSAHLVKRGIGAMCLMGVSFVLAVSGSTIAQAGGATPLKKPASFEERWNGVYGGISIGGGWGQSNTFYDRAGNDHLTPETIDPAGFMFSLNFGYNHQLTDNIVLGIEADIGFMDISAPDRQNLWDGHIWKSRYGGMWGTVRPRIGYVVDDFMIFATGGLAFMETDEYILGDNDATQNTYNSGVHTGWVAGIGVEYALTERISTKLEFLHMEFPEYRGYTNNNELYGFQNSVDMIKIGLNYKF